jgi:DNA-binding response OmpR family regulator
MASRSDASEESPAEPSEGPRAGSAAPILLIEDDEGLRPILARHLRHQGYLVAEADSAEEAVALIRDGLRPCLLVLDVNLPGDTGWQLLRSPVMGMAGSPPVIIASAVTVRPRQLTEFSVAGYLPKPFPLETLLQTVERLLDHDRPHGGVHSDE